MRRLVTVIMTAALVASTAATAVANPWEAEDIAGQGMGGPTVAVDGAMINRSATGVGASVTMATPEPGSYNYPQTPTSSGAAGHPEAFSLWVIVFFNPEACVGACDMPDVTTNPNVVAGGYNAGGHLAAGPKLTLSGRVNAQSATFGGPNAESIAQALASGYDFADAVIHIAIAPHGALAPELLPAQLTTPAGAPGDWWVAVFD